MNSQEEPTCIPRHWHKHMTIQLTTTVSSGTRNDNDKGLAFLQKVDGAMAEAVDTEMDVVAMKVVEVRVVVAVVVEKHHNRWNRNHLETTTTCPAHMQGNSSSSQDLYLLDNDLDNVDKFARLTQCFH